MAPLVSELVGNPEDKFSHLPLVYVCKIAVGDDRWWSRFDRCWSRCSCSYTEVIYTFFSSKISNRLKEYD